jgi:hypothetical protein
MTTCSHCNKSIEEEARENIPAKFKKIDFVIGEPNRVESERVKTLRKIINDEFRGGVNKWDLQCTEYAEYMVLLNGGKIEWPVKYGRHGGKWAEIFKNTKYKVSESPAPGAAISFTKLKGCGHVAFVEKVNPDGMIKISEANWPKDGIYRERDLNKKQQERYGAMFIKFS